MNPPQLISSYEVQVQTVLHIDNSLGNIYFIN